MLAGREKIEGGRCCKSIKLSIQGVESETDLLVVPLGDSQIILYTVCLQGLGPTLRDFSTRTLKL